jgi:3-phenylpropionate/trans-cinnamate dioxygenase ferredoxin subunit
VISQYTKLCAENEVAEGVLIKFEVNGKPIFLTKWDGVIYALDDICTHDGGDLGQGDIVMGQVQCPRHGARFDLKTGRVTRMPAAIGINTYEIKIEDGQIYAAVTD